MLVKFQEFQNAYADGLYVDGILGFGGSGDIRAPFKSAVEVIVFSWMYLLTDSK